MSVQSVALASLTATYTDSEGEDGVDDDLQQDNSMTAAPLNAQVGQPQVHNSPKSGQSASNSPSSTIGGAKQTINHTHLAPNNNTIHSVNDHVTTKRLVSYIDDTIISDDEGTVSVRAEELIQSNSNYNSNILLNNINGNNINNKSFSSGIATTTLSTTTTTVTTNNLTLITSVNSEQSPSRHGELISDGEADSYGIVIPPEPPGQCPAELQEKITLLFKKMESGGLDMNKVIQQRKDFRNPSIYEKLIQFCSINEFGTNYPPDRFDPFKWGKDSYYEDLAKVQKTEMDKLEKARKEKTKIEIVSGTAKRPNSSSNSGSGGTGIGGSGAGSGGSTSTASAAEDEAKKRKSKWDQVATGASIQKQNVLLSQPSLTTSLTSSSANKPTVISAFGSLPKKRL